MKIKKLQLKNINALVGRWQIDFDSDDFYSQGIFAILGATGAGKTTILDAICLAIYGATPRLNKISKSENALMSIGTNECLASVELILDKKVYLFEFSQKRSKNLANDALQEPKHHISEWKNDRFVLISEKKTQSEKLAINLLKMDFTQFTRSVMLAQGSFSAFLQSKTEERAEILEKITGTDIYAKISTKVFETHKQKEQLLKEQQNKLNDIIIMNDDEFFTLQQNIKNSEKNKNNLNNDINELYNKISLATQYYHLKNQHQTNKEKLKEFKEKLELFKPNIIKLEQANHYNKLLPQYQQITFLQKHSEELNQNHLDLTNKLSDLNYDLSKQEVDMNHCQTNLENANEDYSRWQPKLLELRNLTKNLEKLLNDKKTLQTTLDEQYIYFTQLQDQGEKHHNQSNNYKKILEENKVFLEDCQSITTIDVEKQISTPILLFKTNVEKLVNTANLSKQKNNESQILQQEITHHTKLLKDKQEQFYKKQSTLNQLTHHLSVALQTADENEFFNAIRQLEKQLNYKRDLYKNLVDFIKQFHSINEKKEQQKQQSFILTQNQNSLNIKQATLTKDYQHLSQLQDNYHLLEQTYQLKNEIGKLQDYINTLIDGEPCPLCGSTNHPYKHNPPLLSDDILALKAKLNEQENVIKNFEQTLKENERSIIELKSQIMHNKELLNNTNQELEENKAKLITQWGKIFPSLPSNYHIDFYKLNDEILENIRKWLEQTGIDLKKHYENSDYKFKDYQIQSNDLKEECYLIEKSSDSLSFNQEQLNHIDNDYKKYQSECLAIFDDLLDCVLQIKSFILTNNELINQINGSVFNCQSILSFFEMIISARQLLNINLNKNNIQKFDEFINKLSNEMQSILDKLNTIKNIANSAIDIYTKKLLEQEKFAHSINELNTQIKQNNLLLIEQQEKSNKLNGELFDIDTKFIKIKQQILDEFGNINADDKEKMLINHIQICKENLANQIHKHQMTNNEIKNITSSLNKIINSQEKNQTELKLCQNTFNQSLLENFDDINMFLQAKITDDELKCLQNTYDELLLNIQNLTIDTNKNNDELNKILNHHTDIEQWDLSLLNNQYNDLKQALEKSLKESGSNEILYKQAIDNKQKQQHLLSHIAKIEDDLGYYQLLNQLIGSKDGKKYRNFAQRLTLETLLSEANKALIKMTNRYQLTTSNDSKNLLDIAVIDHYQADKIRQSKNLSGGESFIISLALALGLSAMSSQNIQIDSLFLDEGFGTLDENALDIALTALSEIQSTGKMIGVISHISTLKERIGTQILIHKKSGGRSELTGAGVKKLD